MKVLVVGSGGREHALCWAMRESPLLEALYCAPGNAGIGKIARRVSVAADDISGLTTLCRDERIDFVVIGPEAPLVAGLVDRLEDQGVKSFGPTAAAAALEGSKAFTKELCAKYGIPSGAFARFGDADAAKAYIRQQRGPTVVKADGLAAGKGVVVADTTEEACAAVDSLTANLGAAASKLVIEERLVGVEASFFALVDGENVLPLAAAQDHKRVGDRDTGPNTGGMGAFSPTASIDGPMAESILTKIVHPTVAGMASEGRPYRGVLYAGLMLTEDGPKLLEYNVRFGDPEAQVLFVRLKSDLLAALLAARDGDLSSFELSWHDHAAVCVVMATKGYPGSYEKGSRIRNLRTTEGLPGVTVFHAGTKNDDGNIVAVGGRVLGVTATGHGLAQARERAYRAVDTIDWPHGFCRRDIGQAGSE